MCVGVREIVRGCICESHTNKYQIEMKSREMEFCVCESERYFTMRAISRGTYQGT